MDTDEEPANFFSEALSFATLMSAVVYAVIWWGN